MLLTLRRTRHPQDLFCPLGTAAKDILAGKYGELVDLVDPPLIALL